MSTRAISVSGILGAVVTALILSGPLFVDESDGRRNVDAAFYYLLVIGLGFYVALSLGSRRIVRSPRRRALLIAATLVASAIAVMGGGPTGLVVYAPSIALLAWQAARTRETAAKRG